MIRKKYRLILIFLTLLIFILSIIAESMYFGDIEYFIRTKRFVRILTGKELIAEDCLTKISAVAEMNINPESNSGVDFLSLARDEGISLFRYNNGKLAYWSDNSFDVPSDFEDSLFIKPIVFIQNGWFVPKVLELGDNDFIALIKIRSDYSLENDLIINGFEDDFKIPVKVGFSLDYSASDFRINNSKGEFLFSLVFPCCEE